MILFLFLKISTIDISAEDSPLNNLVQHLIDLVRDVSDIYSPVPEMDHSFVKIYVCYEQFVSICV